MSPRTILLPLLAIASLLANGCCCPMLSGRYCEPCCQPSCLPNSPDAVDADNGHCPPIGPLHHCCLSKWFGGLTGDGVPSQQAPDYVSPQPKFHPVPTRPVFEPQLAYPPLQWIEPADSNPLRPIHEPILSGRLRRLPADAH